MAVPRIVAWREHATAGADLDHVGTGTDQLADLLAHLLGPVDDVVRLARMVDADDARHVRAARLPRVAVATGLAEDGDRDLHVGPGANPRCCAVFIAEVAATRLAHGRDTDRQRSCHAFGGEVEVQRERRVHRRHRIEVAVDHEVHVAVDEAGVDGVARGVDRLVAIERGADVDDAVAFDDDIGNRRAAAGAVENLAALDHRRVISAHASVGRASRRDQSGCRCLAGDVRCPSRAARQPVGRRSGRSCRRRRLTASMQRLGAAGVDVGDVGQQCGMRGVVLDERLQQRRSPTRLGLRRRAQVHVLVVEPAERGERLGGVGGHADSARLAALRGSSP